MYKRITLCLLVTLQLVVFTNFALVYSYETQTEAQAPESIVGIAFSLQDSVSGERAAVEVDLCLPAAIPISYIQGWTCSFDYNSYATFVPKTAIPPLEVKPPIIT